MRKSEAVTRLYHLDAVRVFCLIYGFFVHATTVDVSGTLWLISKTSSLFRLEAFFLISGYFGGMLLHRMSVRAFIRKRAVMLLVPLLFGVAFLNPITIYLKYIYHNGYISLGDFVAGDLPAGSHGATPWHMHLWFLISLFSYVLLSPFLVKCMLACGSDRVSIVIRGIPPGALVISLAILAGSGVTVGRGVYQAVLDPVFSATPFSWVARVTLSYLSFYTIGIAAFVYKPVYDALHRTSVPVIAVGVLAALAYIYFEERRGDGYGGVVVYYFTKNFLSLILVSWALVVGEYFFNADYRVIKYLSDRIYTGYILHYIIIYILAIIVSYVGLPKEFHFGFVALAAVAMSFSLHGRVVRRSRILMLLLNGRYSPSYQKSPVRVA